MKLEQTSNGLKCKSCKGYTLDEVPNSHTVDPQDSTQHIAIVNRGYLRKFKCRRCLAEFREVDKEKKLSPIEKYIEKEQEVK